MRGAWLKLSSYGVLIPYRSCEKKRLYLKILAMAWPWAVANKLNRYRKHDPLDMRTVSPTWLWQWDQANCDPSVVKRTSREVVSKIQGRIKDVATRLERWKVNSSPIWDEDVTFDDSDSDDNDAYYEST